MTYESIFICVCTCGVGKGRETEGEMQRGRERKDSNINMDVNCFLFKIIYYLELCVWGRAHTCECWCLERMEAKGPLGGAVTGGCKSPAAGDGN